MFFWDTVYVYISHNMTMYKFNYHNIIVLRAAKLTESARMPTGQPAEIQLNQISTQPIVKNLGTDRYCSAQPNGGITSFFGLYIC